MNEVSGSKLQVIKYWNRIHSSFWFTPTAMAAAAAVLAVAGVALDEPATKWLEHHLNWTFKSGPEGASAVLEVIAGSMITITGVVFSMTLVALSLASSQLGPRLLRNFMRDTTTQVVLGTFIATFVYCLLVIRMIRRAEEVSFVPHLSVSLGVGFALVSVGVLIYFIHHVSISIQANEVAARVGKELIQRVDQLFPARVGQANTNDAVDAPDANFIDAFKQSAQAVGSAQDGYLQLIDGDALLQLAMEENLVIRLERKPGHYIVAGCPLVLISPASRVTNELAKQVQTLFVMGDQRTSDQDIGFVVCQLVEMAVRALSPGLNDPFTAIACVDHLGSGLCRLAARDIPSPYRRDSEHQLRVIWPADTFADVMDTAFDQIRQYGRSSVAVTLRLLETITVIMGFVHRPEDRTSLLRHADMIVRGAREGLPEREDRKAVETCWQAIVDMGRGTLDAAPSTGKCGG